MKDRPRILVVDDEPWNVTLLEKHLLQEGYEVLKAFSGKEALKKVSENELDMVLLDLMMPGMDGLEVCRQIKQQRKFRSIPVILVTALRETVDKVTSLENGADDFLTKPVEGAELNARVRAHLRIKSLMDEIEAWNRTLEEKVEERTRLIEEKTTQLAESYHLTLEALISALDVREHETGKHSLRVAFYTIELANAWGIRGRELEEIAMGALLHDIGKIGISDNILLKPAKLTEEEWVEMKKHPEMGWRMIKDIEFVGRGRDIVLSHQERFDGTGYHRRLKGDQIYIGARFFSVVDTMDAIISERPYQKALPFEVAENEIRKFSGTQFDPKVVEVFFSIPRERWVEIGKKVEGNTFRALIKQIRERYPVL